jgi:apolipoprotein N-acyltransferase
MNPNVAVKLLAAALIGVALRFVVNLEPLWWLAWFVPGLLLALALRTDGWPARGQVALAATIAVTVNAPYFLTVMPLVAMIIVMALQVLLWMFLIGVSRRIVSASDSAWTVLALPVIGVAVDTLLAHFTPDGNWGSLAYTQADVLPIAQLSSVFGVAGILFLLLLVNSVLALAIHRGARKALPACVGAALALVATLGFGYWRLQAPMQGKPVVFGIASIDDFLGDASSPSSDAVWARYQAQVRELAAGGAQVVLLPEKINLLSRERSGPLKTSLASVALDNHVWLVAGLGVDDEGGRRNEAWWFAPDGRLATIYQKHFMAPPEREFMPGHEYPVNDIDGVKYGVAICKDMHFASLGRGFGQRDAAVMLVPAWDFDRDARMAADMTRLRGVESGYAVVRSSRDGLLSVSDAHGRWVAETRSAALPGASLLATVNVGPRLRTLYTRIGDALGWLCVAGLAALVAASLFRRRRAALAPLPGKGV